MATAVLLAGSCLALGFVVGAVFEGVRKGGSLDLRLCANVGHEPEVLADATVSCSRCGTRLMAAVA